MSTKSESPKMQVEPGDSLEIHRKLQQLERRDWGVWGSALFLILFLAGAVILFSLGGVFVETETFLHIPLKRLVLLFALLIGLFTVHTVYQEALIKRLRRELAEKQVDFQRLRNISLIDPLTGLYNRRFAEQRLAAEIARSNRNGLPLTLLLLDLNEFKNINDCYGHPAGDHVLKAFAAHLNRAIRGSDLAVRLGGDEFMVLLPECDLEQSRLVVGRLRPLELDWEEISLVVNFSVGWKQYQPGQTAEDFLKSADEALYMNKRTTKSPAVQMG